MKVKTLILLFITTISFIGCSRQPDVKVVYKERLVKLYPPQHFMEDDISLPKPPSKFSYVTSSPLKRETMLVNYTIDLLKTIKLYKLKLKALREWNNKIRKNTGSK